MTNAIRDHMSFLDLSNALESFLMRFFFSFIKSIRGTSRINLYSEVCDQVGHKSACAALEVRQRLEISDKKNLEASYYLSSEQ